MSPSIDNNNPNDNNNNVNNLPTALQSVIELVREVSSSSSSSSSASSSIQQQQQQQQEIEHYEISLRIPYWCEENIWRLVQYKKQFYNNNYTRINSNYLYVVIVSNRSKSVAMFYQKAAGKDDRACYWDYHVILLQVTNNNQTNDTSTKPSSSSHDVFVYDLDTTIVPYPVLLTTYVQSTFPYTYPNRYAPMFRIIPADLYVQYFSSNRSHMYNVQKQQWNAPPPPYQCICGNDDTITTNEYNTTTTNTNTTNNNNDSTSENTRRPRSNNLHYYLNFNSPIVLDPNVTDCPIEAFGQVISMQQLLQLDFL